MGLTPGAGNSMALQGGLQRPVPCLGSSGAPWSPGPSQKDLLLCKWWRCLPAASVPLGGNLRSKTWKPERPRLKLCPTLVISVTLTDAWLCPISSPQNLLWG